MTPQVNLLLNTQDQIDLIAEALKARQESLRIQLSVIDKEIEDLEKLLQQIYSPKLALESFKETSSLNGYNPSWSWTRKAEYVITKEAKPMTTAEIADTIINKYQVSADRKIIVRNLSVSFATMPHKFKKGQNEKGENIYTVVVK